MNKRYLVTLYSSFMAVVTLLLITDNVIADQTSALVVVDDRFAISRDLLTLESYQNDGRPIIFKVAGGRAYATCIGDWDWDKIQVITLDWVKLVNNKAIVDVSEFFSSLDIGKCSVPQNFRMSPWGYRPK